MISSIPVPYNEPIKTYKPGSPELAQVLNACKTMRNECIIVPNYIDGKKVTSDSTLTQVMPTDHKHKLCTFYQASSDQISSAAESCLKAKKSWAAMPFYERSAIFLRAAELMAGKYRQKLNASIMLGQGKTIYQSEIDLCEGIDFLRFNVKFAETLMAEQPKSVKTMWNSVEWRPLEGFVVAVAPFNFWSIGLNLCTAPAICGNVVIFKPSSTAVLSSWIMYQVLLEAGLPDGVINFVCCRGSVAGQHLFNKPDFAGLHFTGSSATFNGLWKQTGDELAKNTYKSYPRLVGETGGKNFHFLHKSAPVTSVIHNTARAAFEYQGQKCSACATLWCPESLWPAVKSGLIKDLSRMKMGQPDDMTSFVCAVIDEKSFKKISGYIEHAKTDKHCEIVAGGKYSSETGYFIEPTIVKTTDLKCRLMQEEIFGPVLTVFTYPDSEWEKYCTLCANNTKYALTGAIFGNDRAFVGKATRILEYAAGNFYINTKCTAAVVGQQPFGGGRASGTNNKAGDKLNLYSWVTPRTIKQSFTDLDDFTYPYYVEK